MSAQRMGSTAARCPQCHLYLRGDGRCTRCDHLQPLLPSMSVMVTRYCVNCGRRTFVVASYSTRLTCSNSCNNRRWRAIGMLAGTHGYVDHRFTRIAWSADV